MKGKRLLDGRSPKQPGEYAWIPYGRGRKGRWPDSFLGEGEWHIVDPTGGIGAVGRVTIEKPAAHTITVHEDGSITCVPSLVMPGGWHGWLRAGLFSEA